jgi:hypothetical protein
MIKIAHASQSIHIAKSLKKTALRPKLVKEYVCPNALENAAPDKTKISA